MSSNQSSSTRESVGGGGGSSAAAAGRRHVARSPNTTSVIQVDAAQAGPALGSITRDRTRDLQPGTDALVRDDWNQDLHAVSSSSGTTTGVLVPHNAWITSTTVEPAGSVTTEPFPTFWDAAADAAVSKSSSSSVPSSSLSALPSAASNASNAPTLAQAASLGGAGSSGEVRAAVGLTAGLVLAVPIALLAAAAYMRYLPGLCCRRRRRAPPAGQENDFRREKSRRARVWRRDRDLEDAPASPSSHYGDDDGINEDGEERWEEIDVRDPRSGHMEKDDGEWLESWRQRKEKALASLRRAREPQLRLQLDPALPLPPISLEKGESDLA